MEATLGWIAKARRESGRKPWRERLFAQQRAFFDDPSPQKAALTTRRAGKSEVDNAGLVDGIACKPDLIALYVTLTIATSCDNQWELTHTANKRYNLGLEPSDNRWNSPQGGCIWLAGCKDRGEVDKFRGLKYSIIIIDEAGTHRPDVLKYLIDNVLSAARTDTDCPIWLTGTPGMVPRGKFWALTTGADPEVKPWQTHSWSVQDNPHHPFGRDAAALEKYRLQEGFALDSPTWKREFCGEWVLDTSTLIYEYDSKLNGWDDWVASEETRTIIGVDLGYDDKTAFAVTQADEGEPTVRVVEAWGKSQLLPSGIAAELYRLRERYPDASIFVDSGGLGKSILVQLQREYSLPVQAAEKHDKAASIASVQAALRKGQLKLHRNARALLEEWAYLPWDDHRKNHAPGYEDHCSDALLYAFRQHSFGETWERVPPVVNSAEWSRQETDRMRREALEKTVRQ
jgi:Terminase RNaseH-like domain